MGRPTHATPLTTTIEQSRQEGSEAARYFFECGDLTPEMLTAEGADNYGEPGTNLGDAAWYCFSGGASSHREQVAAANDEAMASFENPRALAAAHYAETSEEKRQFLELEEEHALELHWLVPPPSMWVDWADEHWQEFLEGFCNSAKQLLT